MLFRRFVGALAVASFFAAGGACTAPEPLSPREAAEDTPSYVVMTYNIHRDRAGDASTLEAIGASNADIICLQEPTPAWERVIRERYAEAYPHMLFHPAEDAGGLAILSRFPLEDDGIISVEDEWHPAWHAIVHTPAGKVQVMNVHLRAAFDGKSNPVSSYTQTSRDHVTQMTSYMREAHETIPTIVLGDFNESPRGDTIRMLEARGFRNALQLFHPGQFTWRVRSLADSLDMAIDHILFDDSFEPLNAWVDRGGGSDHFPVLAHLELPPRGIVVNPSPSRTSRTSRSVTRPTERSELIRGAQRQVMATAVVVETIQVAWYSARTIRPWNTRAEIPRAVEHPFLEARAKRGPT